MDKTPRNLAIAGCLVDLGALLTFVLLVDDTIHDGGRLTGATALLALGVATLAVIGATAILTAFALRAVEDGMKRLEDRAASYSDGLVAGVHEGITGVVGQLAKALPNPAQDNVRQLHPSNEWRPRPRR